MHFSNTIIHWYHQHKRELPWRNETDAYKIWLSEIILQQTRVEQGKPYYWRFAEKYPTVIHLAKAKEAEVLKLWQGLGYYSRARNLHTTAKIISKKYKGKFPETYNEIIQLKGIGQYTAGAIASFAFGEAKPVVDGNVFRVLSRYFGIVTPIGSTRGKKEFYALAAELLDKKNPGTFNQALMEFGAMQCVPKNPDCSNCPLNTSCFAFAKKKIKTLPVKEKRISVRKRWFYYFVIKQKGKVLLRKRTESDIWKGLHDFPLIETKKKISLKKVLSSAELKNIAGKKFVVTSVSNSFKHVLSHQIIHATFIEIVIRDSKVRGFIPVSKKQLSQLAVPRLIEKYLLSL